MSDGVGWLLGVVADGVVAVGPDVEVAVAVDASFEDRRRLVDALAAGHDAAAIATTVGASIDAGAALLARLRDAGLPGVLARAVPDGEVRPLAAVVGDAAAGVLPQAGVVATAEEALVLPAAIDSATALGAVRRFVAGLEPDGRLEAYALMAAGRGHVVGDAWEPARMRAALARRGPRAGLVGVVGLAGGAPASTVAGAALGRLDASAAHRLGPVLRSWPASPLAVDGAPLHRWLAEVAVGDLSAPSPRLHRRVQGVGENARTIAHAEAAERYAASTHTGAEIVVARRDELDGAVHPHALVVGDARQERERGAQDPDAPRPWCAVLTRDGARRWVPAEAVYLSLAGSASTSGSGSAAHPDAAEARRRAFCELIERDAFMQTWLRRESRPRIDPASVPEDVEAWSRGLARRGWTATWVDLTRDTLAVVLCCLISEREGLVVGAACDGDPVWALRRATQEALVHALHPHLAGDDTVIAPEDVRTPADHALLHRTPARLPDHAFLFASGDTVALAELGPARTDDPEALLQAIGLEPLTVDLTRAESAPYHVVRALVAGLVPITFGWDREPWGLARVGPSACNLPSREARVPHPFA